MSVASWSEQADRLLAAHPHVDATPGDVEALLSACTVRRLPRGEVLCREDDPGTWLFILLEGTIRVSKRDVSGRERPVGTVEAPTLLGQMGIIDRARRTATCTADTDAVVAGLDQGSFQALVRQTSPRGAALRRLLLSSLTRQLVHGNHRMRSLLAARSGTPDAVAGGRAALRHTAGVLEGWTDDAGPDPAQASPSGKP
ncbi:MAG: cyclic nucleotide-binding domain-containing protein [Myxococcota bacterium]|nr:cyclic nucleotide-binding domain-containing protein [Myxococcota bacterium]